jgi:hypothetical protein
MTPLERLHLAARVREWVLAEWILSHLAAARLWELYEGPVRIIDVTVPTDDRRRELDGIRLHRAATLRTADCTTHRGIPVTNLRRTLIDLAGVLSPRGLRSVLRRAEQDHSLSLESLYRSIEQPRSAPNLARLRKALEQWVPKTDLTESDLELEFLTFCATHRLPLPEPQVRFGNYRADFVWEDLRLVVETDSWRYHRGAIAGQNDAAKERFIRARGYALERFTWAEIVNRPAPTARELREIIRRRQAEVAAS